MIIDSWRMQARRNAGLDDVSTLKHFFVPRSDGLYDLKGGVVYKPQNTSLNSDGSLRCYDNAVETFDGSGDLDLGATPSKPVTSGTFANFSGSFGALMVCRPQNLQAIEDENAVTVNPPVFLNIGNRDTDNRTDPGIFLGGTTMTVASGYNTIAGGWNDDDTNHMTLRHEQELTEGNLYLFMLEVDKSSGDGRAEWKRYDLTSDSDYLSHSPNNVDDDDTAGVLNPSTDGTTVSCTMRNGNTTPTVINTVDMQPAAEMLILDMDFYGAAVFDFGTDGIPSDWQHACHWMANAWALGEVGVFPPASLW